MAFHDPESTDFLDFADIPPVYILDWTDESITFVVPGFGIGPGAGSGKIRVTNAEGEMEVSDFSVSVKFNKREYQFKEVDLINDNDSGGYDFYLQADLAANEAAVASLNRAMNQLICKTGVNFNLVASVDTTNCLYGDDLNLISFESSCDTWPFSGAAAWTRVIQVNDCGVARIEEIDIIFVDELLFHFGIDHPGANAFDFETVALHELGHAMGMAHSRDSEKVMFSEIAPGESRRTVGPWFQECADLVMEDSQLSNECGPSPLMSIVDSCDPQISTDQTFVGMCQLEIWPICYPLLLGEENFQQSYSISVSEQPKHGEVYVICDGCDVLNSQQALSTNLMCSGDDGTQEAVVIYKPKPDFVGQDTFMISYVNADPNAIITLNETLIPIVNSCAPSFQGECAVDFTMEAITPNVFQFHPLHPFGFSSSLVDLFAEDEYTFSWDFAEGEPISYSCKLAEVPTTTFAFENTGLHLVCLHIEGPECVLEDCNILVPDFGECGSAEGPFPMTWYADTDGDGLGDGSNSVSDSCFPPPNFVLNADDMDDNCFSNYLDECGVCDGTGPLLWYEDDDGDGLGNPDISVSSCTEVFGYVSNNADVDDTVSSEQLRPYLISISPNPATDWLRVELLDSDRAIDAAYLISSTGIAQQLMLDQGAVDISSFSPGVYILSIQLQGLLQHHKLIIY